MATHSSRAIPEDVAVAFCYGGSTHAVVMASLADLNSLKRSYKAYLHTSDPRMTAIAAYVTAYAQFELDNEVAPTADDPMLGDAALEAALASATKTGRVSPAVLDQAKEILGVGGAEGKIDQIRGTLTKTPIEETKPGEEAQPGVMTSVE
jgi:hypothetical protein